MLWLQPRVIFGKPLGRALCTMCRLSVTYVLWLNVRHMKSAMVPLDRAMTSSYTLSIVTMCLIYSGLAAILNASCCLRVNEMEISADLHFLNPRTTACTARSRIRGWYITQCACFHPNNTQRGMTRLCWSGCPVK